MYRADSDAARHLALHFFTGTSGTLGLRSAAGAVRVALDAGWIAEITRDGGPRLTRVSLLRRRALALLDAPVDRVSVAAAATAGGPRRRLHPLTLIRQHTRRIPRAALGPLVFRLAALPLRLVRPAATPWFLFDDVEAALVDRLSTVTTWAALQHRWSRDATSLARLLVFLDRALLLRPGPRQASTARDHRWRAAHTLGVPRGASPEQIRSVYRKLALAYHPDRHPGASAAERDRLATRFSTIASAYQTLRDTVGAP